MGTRKAFYRAIAEICLAEQGLSLQPDPCPDQDVGIVDEITGRGVFVRRNVGPRNGRHRVILILESPHVDEFAPPIGPANGGNRGTGAQIRRYLLQVAGLGDVGQFRLILMNPVQYQCSLGAPGGDARRAHIFARVWALGGKRNFQDRLDRYFLEGDRLVNCCSAEPAHGGIVLKELVQDAIEEVLPRYPVLLRYHPSRWSIRRHREAQE